MTIVSLLGLATVLAIVALVGLKPWEDNSVEPRLTLPGVVEVGVGEAVALPSGPAVAVADRAVVRGGAELDAASRPVDKTVGREFALAVAPARAVAVVDAPAATPTEPEAGPGDEVPSVEAPDGEAPPEETPLPVSTPSPAPGSPGPTTAVLESCEGDEYVITVVLVPGADEDGEAEEASVEIVLQRFNEDGSVDELTLEGNALDAESLALQLSSEGNCVVLEASP